MELTLSPASQAPIDHDSGSAGSLHSPAATVLIACTQAQLSAKRDRVLAPGERSEPGETETKTISEPRERAKDSVASFAASNNYDSGISCMMCARETAALHRHRWS